MLNLSLPRCHAHLLHALSTSRPWRYQICCKLSATFPPIHHVLRNTGTSTSAPTLSRDVLVRAAVPAEPGQMPNSNDTSGSGRAVDSSCSAAHNGADTSIQSKLESLKLGQTLYDQPTPFCVVNFYHLTVVQDPLKVVAEHRKYLEQKDIRGRIWISAQGINAQYGGTRADAVEYAEWVSQQEQFQGLRFSVWPADGHMFPKLRLKHKPNLISLSGGMSDLPVHDPESRATPLQPEDWKKMLQEAKTLNSTGRQVSSTPENSTEDRIVILDVRNDYEWDAGHFEGAPRPAEEEFAETPTVLQEQDVPAPLQGMPKDTKVMMYCTGGIRCDVYSTLLKKKGFNNLYTLEGGIQNYLRQEGGDLWNGSLFVFDGRMALPAAKQSAEDAESAPDSPTLPAAVPCQLCGSDKAELPHMNCANIDCNELFISCPACKSRWNGCCCEECMKAPRLVRPIQLDGGRFGAWGNYVDPDDWHPVIASGRSPEGRVARRERRRKAAQAKRQQMIAERNARKQLMRAVMAEIAKKAEQSEEEKPATATPVKVES